LREKLSLDLEEEGKVVIDVPGVGDGKVEVPKELLTIEKRTRVEYIREIVPNVIEPSFGIGRIVYAICEHNFWTREGDEARGVLSFPPAIAPTSCLIVPLSSNSAFKPFVYRVGDKLQEMGISSRVDDSGASIGKRYSRNDELGTGEFMNKADIVCTLLIMVQAFGITIDFQTVKDSTVTLREVCSSLCLDQLNP